jgi:hypothetical protein
MFVIEGLVSIAIAVAIVAVYWVLYRRAVPRPEALPPRYLTHDPAGLPPAMVGMLFQSGMTADKLAATLLDLVRRGVILMSEPAEDVPLPFVEPDDARILRLRRDRLDGLRVFERDFVYEIFDHMGGGGDEIQLGSLRRWWSAFPATARVGEGIIAVRIHRELVAEGLVDPLAAGKKRQLSVLAAETLAGLLLIFVVGPWALLFLALAIVLQVWTQRVTGLTRRGAKVAARYESFRRYLIDYGRFRDRTADAVIVWGEYLPLAIVLGVAREAETELSLGGSPFLGGGHKGTSFPDEDEALDYLELRRQHDPSLPGVRFVRRAPPELRLDEDAHQRLAAGPWVAAVPLLIVAGAVVPRFLGL